jgi:hypothetical protein
VTWSMYAMPDAVVTVHDVEIPFIVSVPCSSWHGSERMRSVRFAAAWAAIVARVLLATLRSVSTEVAWNEMQTRVTSTRATMTSINENAGRSDTVGDIPT